MENKLRVETEKEFKYELSRDDFFRLDTYLEQFGYRKMEAIEQVNYYIDTEDLELRGGGTTLRVRHFLKTDEFELTAKVKSKVFSGSENLKVKEELNMDITKEQAEDIINNGMIKEYVYLFLEKAPLLRDEDIQDRLVVLGNLKTKRQNYYINDYTFISLDESSYFDKVDYELELETNNEEEDKKFLEDLFKELHIAIDVNNKSKVKRFLSRRKMGE